MATFSNEKTARNALNNEQKKNLFDQALLYVNDNCGQYLLVYPDKKKDIALAIAIEKWWLSLPENERNDVAHKEVFSALQKTWYMSEECTSAVDKGKKINGNLDPLIMFKGYGNIEIDPKTFANKWDEQSNIIMASGDENSGWADTDYKKGKARWKQMELCFKAGCFDFPYVVRGDLNHADLGPQKLNNFFVLAKKGIENGVGFTGKENNLKAALGDGKDGKGGVLKEVVDKAVEYEDEEGQGIKPRGAAFAKAIAFYEDYYAKGGAHDKAVNRGALKIFEKALSGSCEGDEFYKDILMKNKQGEDADPFCNLNEGLVNTVANRQGGKRSGSITFKKSPDPLYDQKYQTEVLGYFKSKGNNEPTPNKTTRVLKNLNLWSKNADTIQEEVHKEGVKGKEVDKQKVLMGYGQNLFLGDEIKGDDKQKKTVLKKFATGPVPNASSFSAYLDQLISHSDDFKKKSGDANKEAREIFFKASDEIEKNAEELCGGCPSSLALYAAVEKYKLDHKLGKDKQWIISTENREKRKKTMEDAVAIIEKGIAGYGKNQELLKSIKYGSKFGSEMNKNCTKIQSRFTNEFNQTNSTISGDCLKCFNATICADPTTGKNNPKVLQQVNEFVTSWNKNVDIIENHAQHTDAEVLQAYYRNVELKRKYLKPDPKSENHLFAMMFGKNDNECKSFEKTFNFYTSGKEEQFWVYKKGLNDMKNLVTTDQTVVIDIGASSTLKAVTDGLTNLCQQFKNLSKQNGSVPLIKDTGAADPLSYFPTVNTCKNVGTFSVAVPGSDGYYDDSYGSAPRVVGYKDVKVGFDETTHKMHLRGSPEATALLVAQVYFNTKASKDANGEDWNGLNVTPGYTPPVPPATAGDLDGLIKNYARYRVLQEYAKSTGGKPVTIDVSGINILQTDTNVTKLTYGGPPATLHTLEDYLKHVTADGYKEDPTIAKMVTDAKKDMYTMLGERAKLEPEDQQNKTPTIVNLL